MQTTSRRKYRRLFVFLHISNMNKQKELERIAKEIDGCEICKQGKSGLPVPGEGNPDAKIVFMGEAPGKTEARTGRPFVGRSGKLLRQLIRENNLAEDRVFITSPVKYLPNKGTPSKSDIEHGMVHTQKQLDIIKPEYIVLLGNTAIQGLLKEKLQITKLHGKIIERDRVKYFLTFHPSAGLRFVKIKHKLHDDFLKLSILIEN